MVELLIVVLGHLVPSFFCCGCRLAEGKMLCGSEVCRELKLAGSNATAPSAAVLRKGRVPWERNEEVVPPPAHHLFLLAQEKRRVGLSVVRASYANWTRFSELQIIPAEEM